VLHSVITAYIHEEQGYIFSHTRIAIIRPELQDTKGLFATVISNLYSRNMHMM